MIELSALLTDLKSCTKRDSTSDLQLDENSTEAALRIMELGKATGPNMQMKLFIPDAWYNSSWPLRELNKKFKGGIREARRAPTDAARLRDEGELEE